MGAEKGCALMPYPYYVCDYNGIERFCDTCTFYRPVEQGFYPGDRGQVQGSAGRRDCLLLGLYPSGDDWFGVLVAKAGGRLDYWFKHVFTPKEVQAVFVPLGGIDAVYGRFYAEFLGMQVTI